MVVYKGVCHPNLCDVVGHMTVAYQMHNISRHELAAQSFLDS